MVLIKKMAQNGSNRFLEEFLLVVIGLVTHKTATGFVQFLSLLERLFLIGGVLGGPD